MHITIGAPATETSRRTFRCPKGHQITSSVPITIGYFADAVKGNPICPICLAAFVREQFPMEEVVEIRVVPVAQATAPAPTLMVEKCLIEGCILNKHPVEQAHIDVQRRQF